MTTLVVPYGKERGMRWSRRKELGNGYLVENAGIGQSGFDGSVDPGNRMPAFASRAGHDGIRHPRRRARGHRHPGDHGVPSVAAGAVERHCGRHQRLVAELLGQDGQSTVEFAVVTAGFLVVTVALVAFARMLGDGLIIEHALAVASHHIQAVAPATIVDVFLY